jgi:hypothetical protein
VRYLKEFFQAHRKLDWNDELGQYISFALSVDGPPDFKWRYSTERTPPAANALEDLAPLLKEFWTEGNLEQAWQAAQPTYDRIIARYHEPLTNAILQANLYLKNPTSGARGRRFQIYVDLLGAPNQVHTRGFVDDYFVVITPSAQLRVADVRRASTRWRSAKPSRSTRKRRCAGWRMGRARCRRFTNRTAGCCSACRWSGRSNRESITHPRWRKKRCARATS